MNRTFGADLVLIWGLVANFGAFFAVVAPLSKRLLNGFVGVTATPVLCFALAFCWMLLSEYLYQKRRVRKGDCDLRFLSFFHFAPTGIICLAAFFLHLALVH